MGTPSVCEVVTPAMARSLLAGTGGRLSSDDAYRLCDYHLADADDALLEQVVRMSDLTRWDAEAILDDLGYAGDADRLLTRGGSGRANSATQATSARAGRKRGVARAAVGLLALAAGALLGGVLVTGAVLAVIVIALLSTASGSGPRADRYPDVRSDHSRRVWADGHDFDADGDADHNWEADGDRPW